MFRSLLPFLSNPHIPAKIEIILILISESGYAILQHQPSEQEQLKVTLIEPIDVLILYISIFYILQDLSYPFLPSNIFLSKYSIPKLTIEFSTLSLKF